MAMTLEEFKRGLANGTIVGAGSVGEDYAWQSPYWTLGPGGANPVDLPAHVQYQYAAAPDPAPQSAAPQPSLAEQMASFNPTPWAQERGLGEMERLINFQQPLPPEFLQQLMQGSSAPSGDPRDMWNDYVRRAQYNPSPTLAETIMSPQNLFFAGTTGQGGMALANAATGGDVGAGLQQDATTLASTIAGQYLAGQGAFAPEVANSGMDFGGQGVGWSPDTITGATTALPEVPVAPVSEPTTLQELIAQAAPVAPTTAAPTTSEVLQIYRDAGVPDGIVGQAEAEYWANSGYSSDAIRQQIEAGYGDYVRSLQAAQTPPVSEPTTLQQLLQAQPEPYVPTLADAGITQTYTPSDPFLVNPSTAETPWLSNAPSGSVFSPEASTPTLSSIISPQPAALAPVAAPITTPQPAPQPSASVMPPAEPMLPYDIKDAGLTQTMPGYYENVANLDAFGPVGSTLPSGTPPGASIAAPVASAVGPAATTAAATAAAAGAGGIGATKLSDVLSGEVNPLDNLTLGNLGTAGATLGSMYASNQQAEQLKAMYDQYLGLGAPSRQRYEASFQPGFDITNDPAFKSALDATNDSLLRRASIGGNPAGNPGVLAEINKYTMSNLALPTLQNYRNQNAATGGFGAYSTAAPGVGTGAISAAGNVASDLGRGVSNILNPPTTLEQFFKQMKGTTTMSLP